MAIFLYLHIFQETQPNLMKIGTKQIFSNHEGSSAAPTAGLHFDDIVFSSHVKKQIDHCFCTLHIGLGTFSPIRTQKLDNHVLHQEYYSIPLEKLLIRLKNAKKEMVEL